MRNLGSYKPAVLSFTHVNCATVYPINHILVMYALAHGEDVWPQGRYEASRSRVTNFVSKTYSKVTLVIDLWDQTGPDWSPPWNGGVAHRLRTRRSPASSPSSVSWQSRIEIALGMSLTLTAN